MTTDSHDHLANRVKEAAFDWAVDYKPCEDDLAPNEYAEHRFIRGAEWAMQNLVLILGHHADGGCVKLGIVTKDFDVQEWAETKRDVLKTLNIVKVETINL